MAYTGTIGHDTPQSQSSQAQSQSLVRRPSEALRADEQDDEEWDDEKKENGQKEKEVKGGEGESEDKLVDVRMMVMSELLRWIDERLQAGGHSKDREGWNEINQGSEIEPLALGISALLRWAYTTHVLHDLSSS